VLKITPTRKDDEKSLRVCLCGQLTKEYVPEIERLLNDATPNAEAISLDLADVSFVDREAMVFLCSTHSRKNISIENVPPYVIRWIKQERLCGSTSDEE
jgi:ABC-type transporter Mla MlaB component